MAIAEAVSNLNVRDAKASIQVDKDMIDEEIRQNGGFDEVSAFIRTSIATNLNLMRENFDVEFHMMI
jgi:hypothetical protein